MTPSLSSLDGANNPSVQDEKKQWKTFAADLAPVKRESRKGTGPFLNLQSLADLHIAINR